MSKYLLSVKCGEYEGKDGKPKGRYKQVGSVEEHNNGNYARVDAITMIGICQLTLAKGETEFFMSFFEPKQDAKQSEYRSEDVPF